MQPGGRPFRRLGCRSRAPSHDLSDGRPYGATLDPRRRCVRAALAADGCRGGAQRLGHAASARQSTNGVSWVGKRRSRTSRRQCYRGYPMAAPRSPRSTNAELAERVDAAEEMLLAPLAANIVRNELVKKYGVGERQAKQYSFRCLQALAAAGRRSNPLAGS